MPVSTGICTARPSTRRLQANTAQPVITWSAPMPSALRPLKFQSQKAEERVKINRAYACLLLLLMTMSTNASQSNLQSRAERTNYEETSRYADVMEFIARLQQLSANVKLESFAITTEGRALPLVILANPAVSSPAEAAASGKPVVFIMANIHAGEVEGKEACQHLMRDIVTGPVGFLAHYIVLLVAPNYNPDGNEKIDINNRTAQNGPSGGVGTRENGKQMDLNRDFMKLEDRKSV